MLCRRFFAFAIGTDLQHEFPTQRGYGEFKDGWKFPGGKVEAGETPREALVREIEEERYIIKYFSKVESVVNVPDEIVAIEGLLPPNFTAKDVKKLSAIKEIHFGKGLERLGEKCFAATKLKTITFDSDAPLKVLPICAFKGAEINEIVIPKNIEKIDEDAFSGCKSLKVVKIEKESKLQYLEKFCFAFCSKLESTDFTNCESLSYVDEKAFEGCPKLKNPTLPKNPIQEKVVNSSVPQNKIQKSNSDVSAEENEIQMAVFAIDFFNKKYNILFERYERRSSSNFFVSL